MKNVPKNHHYVPRFILKNFASNDLMINLYDIRKKQVSFNNLKFKFMRKNLYKDPTREDVMEVEKKFSQLENEVSQIIERFLYEKQRVTVTRYELMRLKKFFFLMEFRSERRRDQYLKCNFDVFTKSIIDQHVEDGDYLGLWIRELAYILDNDIDNMVENPDLTWMIKTDLSMAWKHTFLIVWDSYQGEEFVLTDNYGTFEWSSNMPIKTVHLYPISPRRMLGFANKAYEHPKGVVHVPTRFSIELFKFPKNKKKILHQYKPDDEFIYQVIRISNHDVRYTNHLLLNEATNLVCYSDASGVYKSFKTYIESELTKKNDYSGFLKSLDEK